MRIVRKVWRSGEGEVGFGIFSSQILRVGQSSPGSRSRVLIGCGKVKLKPR